MNKLKKNIIYQYMLVASILVIASVYLFIFFNKISSFLDYNIILKVGVYIVFLFIEIALFSGCAHWYYKKISFYISEETNRQIKHQAEIFANLAHDLKSPITTLIGLSRALEENLIKDDEREETIHIITEKSKHMDKLINLIFQYTKMELPHYKLKKSNVEITRIVKESVAQRYNDFEKNNISLDIVLPSEKIILDIDELEFRRVIDNLITNAIIHNPDEIKIQIGLESFKSSIKIWIADSGIDISENIEDKIFEPFICAKESRNTKGGSGLGLAISKKIIMLHDGELFIEKNIDGYNKAFIIILNKKI